MSSVEEQLEQLRKLYREQLPAKLEEILSVYRRLDVAQWNTQDADALHRLIHSLTGTAGTFGFQSISELSRTVERLLAAFSKATRTPNAAEWQAFNAEFNNLQQLVHSCLATAGSHLKPPAAALKQSSDPLIHIIEDDAEQAHAYASFLMEAGYRILIASDAPSYQTILDDPASERPAAVLMDLILPQGSMAGIELIKAITERFPSHPPVVTVSSHHSIEARLQAFRAGASRYLIKPIAPGRLIDILDELTGRLPGDPYRILMVDDDLLLLEAQAAMLRDAGMTVHTLSQPLHILDKLDQVKPDLVVLDMHMPDASGPELAAALREREDLTYLPILFLSSETDISQQLMALNLGGDDFLVKPVQPSHLVAAVTARARRTRQIIAMQKRLQANLYEREREHLALNQHAIVSIADRAGNITYVNDKFCEVSGYAYAELIGQNHRILKSGEHPPEFYRNIWRTIVNGKVWNGEICNRRKDGSHYWVESTITPFLGEDGKPYQYVSIRTDITHVKQSEEALRASETRLNLAQQVSHVGSFDWYPKSGELTWSDEHYRLWGLAPGSVTPSFELFRAAIHADDIPKLEQQLQAAMENRTMFNIDYRIRRPDGSEHIMHSRGEFTYDENGEATQLTGTVQDMTEHTRIEREIELSKERLRRGQEFANIGTWDWNILTGELYWTERIAPLFGHPVGELDTSYENFLNSIHPDDRQNVVDAVNACVERDIPYSIEHRVIWPDGTVRWLYERGAVVRDAQGKPLQMLGVVQDIDDRKRAELALIEREAELREAQTLARIGNWSANMLTGELHWSDEIYRIFGYEPGSISPSVETFMNAVHPDDRELVRASELNAQHTGQHNVVHRIVWPDGTIRHVHELAQAENDASGKLIRLSGTVQDITERIEAETRLRESEERFAFAVEGAGDGIWDWDMRTGAMPLSGHYEAMLGYQKGDLEPTINAWINSVHPEDLPRVQQNLESYLTGKLDSYVVELRLHCMDDSYKWVLCRGTVVARDRDGKPVRMIGIHSDITERKIVEQALVQASEEANRANQAKSEFLSSMSHELRTPMNAILGFGQLLEYDEGLNAEQHDNIKEILHAGEHLLQLINEVLDLSKIESGRIDLSLEPVDISSILDETLSLVTTIAERKNIIISHSNIQGAVVRADRTRLKQTLLNLLTNAIKYNRPNGTVHVDVRKSGTDMMQIRVADTGHGIPAARLHELFQPFNRLGAENSGIEGSGIGLTITRRIVEMMGGKVGVDSEEGVGSTFWIELPLEDAMLDLSQSFNNSNNPMPEENELKSSTILYIEDNPSNLRLMSQILGKRKHINLLTAHTPELGIELARARLPDLILLDINMPGMNGYQVLDMIRQLDELKAIPVIAVTANAMPRDIERGIAAGFDNYLTKPIDIIKLFLILDNYLAQSTD